MRGSPENENTKIRNSLTNVHERSRCVCLSMTVLACASGIVRPRDVAKTAHGCRGYGNMATKHKHVDEASAHDSDVPMILGDQGHQPGEQEGLGCLLKVEADSASLADGAVRAHILKMTCNLHDGD